LRVQLADTSLQHQLRNLEFRYLAQQHQIKQLKALPSQVELLTQQLQGSEQQLTNLQQVNRRLSIRLKAQQKQLERFSFKLEQSEQERDKLKQQSYSEAAT
jgi:phage-related minor tail protein